MRRDITRTACPHCGSLAFNKKSEQITQTYREITFACSNLHCGFIFVTSLTPIRALSPAAIPNPHIDIPLVHTRKNAS